MLSFLLAAAVATSFPDDADQASLLAAVARTRAYLATVRKPTLALLGRQVSVARFRRSAERFEQLVKERWGTPAFDEALAAEFEHLTPPDAVRFTGKSRSLGDVSFEGRLDRQALAAAKAAGPGGAQASVLTGTLTIAGHAYPNVAFTWFGGD